MRFTDQLAAAMYANGSHLCIGLDPVSEQIADGDVVHWAATIVDATRDLACCYKPNSAFYEALGPHGFELLAEVIANIPREIPVLLDAKRGDVDNTAAAYARAAYDVLGAGAVTVNPYLGGRALASFLSREDRAVFVICRTSNEGAGELQDVQVVTDAGPRPLYEVVAERARAWNRAGNVGLVAGATYPAEIGRIRLLCPDQLLLVPGVGPQGGALAAAVSAAGDRHGGGFLVNASRQVSNAGHGAGLGPAARAAALQLRDAIEAARREQLEHAG